MHEPIVEAKTKRLIETHWWIYFAFVMGVVLIFFVGARIMASHSLPSSSDLAKTKFETIRWTFIGLSLMLVAANVWLRKNPLSDARYYKECVNIQELSIRFGRYLLWSLGMSELVAILSWFSGKWNFAVFC